MCSFSLLHNAAERQYECQGHVSFTMEPYDLDARVCLLKLCKYIVFGGRSTTFCELATF